MLNHEDGAAGTLQVRIRPVTGRLRKDGSITDEKPYDPENVTRPKERLSTRRRSAPSSRAPRSPVRSRCLRFGQPSGLVLRESPARRAEPRWIKIGPNEQRLTLVPVVPVAGSAGDMEEFRPENPPDSFNHVLPLNPPHYVDLTAGQIGVIETALPPLIAREVANAPAITMSEAASVKEMMRQRLWTKPSPAQQESTKGARHDDLRRSSSEQGDPEHLPLPDAPDNVDIRAVTPVPRLELMVALVRLKSNYFWYMNDALHREAFPLPVARLSFDYRGEIVNSTSPVQTLERVRADRLILTPRDMQVEQKAGERLASLGLKALNSPPLTGG